MGHDNNKSKYIINPIGERIYDEVGKEQVFREFWAPIYDITPEENQNYCIETENMVRQHLFENHNSQL